ncbi:hypothetical protein ACH4ND_01380 [Streptomyces sp. NPDC017179]|uniref:hypothetical protein n=1 Tax=Streptomyces sp. NPDC017179 TaxID=3364979 RepID=UPI0037A21F39
MSRSKAKGTAAETAVVRFLQAAGFVQAERRTLNGVKDRGDIAGVPGVVIEVKNCARQELPAWVAEAELERDNDRASLGVVWHKRRGKSDPGDWFVSMSGHQFAELLREQQGLPAPAAEPSPRCTCGETACESELCDCDSVPCPVDHAAEAQQGGAA